RAPGAPVGWNCTITVQVEPAGRDAAQVPPATTANWVMSAPLMAATSVLAAPALGLLTVKAMLALMAPAVTAPKSTGVGEISRPPAAVPVPDRFTVAVLPPGSP